MGAVKKVLGLMSGTSLDGVDLALMQTDGEAIHALERHGFEPYPDETRSQLRAVLDEAVDWSTASLQDKRQWPEALLNAEAMVTQAHETAVAAFLNNAGSGSDGVELIGFHGQTVTHRPDEGFTLQIGDGQALAQTFAVDVVEQMRLADMAAGGQGAPLAPLYHAALAGPARPQAVLNLGGIGNLTWLGNDDAMLAFDTGPANALIDDWVKTKTGAAYDADGALAAQGEVNEDAVAALMMHRFFETAPPKSLDRLAFDMEPVRGLSDADGAATLTAFTAASVARGLSHCPEKPVRLILCGGGRHNKTLAAMLASLADIGIVDCDMLGWQGDSLEAQAFAWLAVRAVRGLPLSRPETTGASAAVSGGIIHTAG